MASMVAPDADQEKALVATINLHKKLHKVGFKKRAARAVRTVKAFAKKVMGTDDVRIDVDLNKYIWHKGIRNVPRRVRVKMERHVGVSEDGDDESDEVKMYTIVKNVPVDSFKGLLNEEATVDAEEEAGEEEDDE